MTDPPSNLSPMIAPAKELLMSRVVTDLQLLLAVRRAVRAGAGCHIEQEAPTRAA